VESPPTASRCAELGHKPGLELAESEQAVQGSVALHRTGRLALTAPFVGQWPLGASRPHQSLDQTPACRPSRQPCTGVSASGPSRVGAGSPVRAAVDADRAIDEGAKHLEVHVLETLYVQASLASRVGSQSLQQPWIAVLHAADEVQNEVCLPRREPNERGDALVTTVIAIAVGAEPHDARTPYRRRFARPLGK